MPAIFWTKHSHLTFSQFIDSVEGVLDEQQVAYLRQVEYNNQIAVDNFEELNKDYQDETKWSEEKLSGVEEDLEVAQIEIRQLTEALEKANSEVESLREVVKRLTQLDLQMKGET